MHENNKTPPFLLLPWSAAVAHQVAEDDEGRKPYVLTIADMGDDARGAGTPRGGGAAERRGIFGGIFRYFRTTTGVVHYPPRKHRRPLLFRGSPATNQPPDGGGIQRTQYKSVKKIPPPPPFRAYWNHPTSHYLFLIWSLFSIPYTLHICFIHVAFVSDIYKSPVPRKRGQMGYTRLCKR